MGNIHIGKIFYLQILAITILSVFAAEDAYASPSVSLDSSTYFIDHSAKITITGETPNLSGLVASLTSTNPSTGQIDGTLAISNGFAIPLYENPIGSGIYSSDYVHFTTLTNPSSLLLPTNDNDVIQASYTDTGGNVDLSSPSTILDSTYGIVPPMNPSTPQPNLSVIINCGTDSDRDSLCDTWEVPSGLRISYNGHIYTYYCGTTVTDPTQPLGSQANPDPICPSTTKKDVYVEADWMPGHKPSQTVINDIVNAFSAKGIRLHIQLDENIGYHADTIYFNDPTGNNLDFYHIKKTFFGTMTDRTYCPSSVGSPGSSQCIGYISDILTAKRQAFHYMLFVHSYAENPGSSGIAEIMGNDFIVSLGAPGFTGSVGSVDEQEGTFMHELGHNLGLDHAGPIGTGAANPYPNCKPNYPSVMNYIYQFSDFVPRILSYSSGTNPQLDQTNLDENTVMTPTPSENLVVGPLPAMITPPGPVDWDKTIPGQTGVSAQIDNFQPQIPDCNPQGTSNTLTDYNDWNLLAYKFRSTTNSNFTSNGAPANPTGFEEKKSPIVLVQLTIPNATRNTMPQSELNNMTATSNPSDNPPDTITFANGDWDTPNFLSGNEIKASDVAGMRFAHLDELSHFVKNLGVATYGSGSAVAQNAKNEIISQVDRTKADLTSGKLLGAIDDLLKTKSKADIYFNAKQDASNVNASEMHRHFTDIVDSNIASLQAASNVVIPPDPQQVFVKAFISPYKQQLVWHVSANHISCLPGYSVMIKNSSGTGNCILVKNVSLLESRGWGMLLQK